jgi:hypothetical protein
MTCGPTTCCNNCCPSAPDITVEQTTITIDEAAANFTRDLFSRDAGTILTPFTGLTLSATPIANANVALFRNGSKQAQTKDYTITGSAITLVVAAEAGESFEAQYLAAS